MTNFVWKHTDSPYAVATLSKSGFVLAIAEALGTDNVQFAWDWQAADGSGNTSGWPVVNVIDRQLHRTFASGAKTVRGEPVEPHFLPMNALRQAQGERMKQKSCYRSSRAQKPGRAC